MHPDQLINFLQTNFDLTWEQAKTYVSLAELGTATVAEVAKHTGQNRITTHGYIEHLLKLEFIKQDKRGNKRVLIVRDPHILLKTIERQEQELLNAEAQLPDVLGQLKLIQKTEHTSEMKYYVGQSELKQLHAEISHSQNLFTYTNMQAVIKVFPENADQYLNTFKTVNQTMQIKTILFDEPIAREYAHKIKSPRYQAKFIKSEIGLVDYIIFDGKVAIIELIDNPVGVLIANQSYFESAKSIFEFIWSTLP